LISPEYVERQKKKQESSILLPEDYARVESRYCTAKVLATAPDCALSAPPGTRILVDRSMIEEVECDGEKSYLILANYVLAEIGENT